MLEGAQPASNGIECPAMPCAARFAASKARTFVPHQGTKVTAFLKAVIKVRRDFYDSLSNGRRVSAARLAVKHINQLKPACREFHEF